MPLASSPRRPTGTPAGPSIRPLAKAVGLGLIVLGLLVPATSDGASAKRRATPYGTAAARCTPPAKQTLMASDEVVVYVQGPQDRERYYACRRGSRQRIKLGEMEMSDVSISSFNASGRYVAFSHYGCPRNAEPGCSGFLRIVDVRRRKVRLTWELPSGSYGSPSSLQLSETGAAAWTLVTYPTGLSGGPLTSLYAAPAGGKVATLDAGGDLESASVALAFRPTAPPVDGQPPTYGPIVYWFKGGVPQSAPLR